MSFTYKDKGGNKITIKYRKKDKKEKKEKKEKHSKCSETIVYKKKKDFTHVSCDNSISHADNSSSRGSASFVAQTDSPQNGGTVHFHLGIGNEENISKLPITPNADGSLFYVRDSGMYALILNASIQNL